MRSDPYARRRRAGLDSPRLRPRSAPSDGANGNGNGHAAFRLRGIRQGQAPPETPGGGTAGVNGNGNGGQHLRRRRASLYRRGFRRPPRTRMVRITLIILAVLLGLTATGAGVAFAGYNIYKSELPDAATIAAAEPSQDSYVYDSAGSLIYVFHDPGSRHDHVALANISRWVKLATVDVEDRHFYSEGSWDLPRLIGVGFNDLTHGSTAGASTITEQLAKISFFGSNTPRSLDYKIKEIVLGNEIGSNFTKDQVLEMYLNRIFYGNYATGIQSAAELYFHLNASQLDLAQSAMLAGLPQSPSYYNPLYSVSQAKARQHDVLRAMVANGDVTDAQARAAFAEPLTFHSWTESQPVVAPDFLQYLQSWLTDNFGSAYTKPGGWRIYTTLDPVKQALAEKTVQQQINQNGARFNMYGAALVTMDPRTGEVLDMVGTGNPGAQLFGNLNLATSYFTPGSTIKLFTYAAAIASGKFTMTTPILDAPYTWHLPGGQTYAPFDYDRRWHGTCELKACLGNSLNMPAVKVEVATGVPYISNLELAVGVNSLTSQCYSESVHHFVTNFPETYQYATTLGGFACGVRLVDLANGAATIADMGVRHDAIPVTKIVETMTGQTVFAYNPAAVAKRVLPDNVAYIMNEITSNDANRVNEFGAHGLLTLGNRRVSAKTGTGENFVDNLTVGWTPDLLTAVWVGNPDPSCSTAQLAEHYKGCGTLNGISSGITGAAPIWHDFMSGALAGTPMDWYKQPADVVASGTGDNANFFLPGTQSEFSGGCFYWGPSPDPTNPCQYTGTGPPPWYQPGVNPTPAATASPTPGGVRPTGPPTAPPGPPTQHQ